MTTRDDVATAPISRGAVTDRLRRGPGLVMVGLLHIVAVVPLVFRSVPLATWQNPPWLLVIATGVGFLALWGASLATLLRGFSGDYTTTGRSFLGLARSDAPWALRDARWPAFTLGLALFVAMNRKLGAPLDAVTFAAQMSLTALVAGALASWGAPRGLRVEGGWVRFDRWITQRSVRADSVARTSPTARGDALRLHLRDGRVIDVPVSLAAGSRHDVIAAIHEACRGAKVEVPPEGEEARWSVLDREGRELSTWRADLTRLLQGDRGFRAAPVSRADLERLLADARTPAGRRLAAALALWDTRAEAPGTAEHIRAAARTTDDTHVRAALLDVVDDDVDARTVERVEAAAAQRA